MSAATGGRSCGGAAEAGSPAVSDGALVKADPRPWARGARSSAALWLYHSLGAEGARWCLGSGGRGARSTSAENPHPVASGKDPHRGQDGEEDLRAQVDASAPAGPSQPAER